MSGDWSDHRVEQTVGNLLRIGVLLSTAIVLVGGAVYLFRHADERAAKHHDMSIAPGLGRNPLHHVVAVAPNLQT